MLKKMLVLMLLVVGGCGVTFVLPAPDPLDEAKRECMEWEGSGDDADANFDEDVEVVRLNLRRGLSREAALQRADEACSLTCLFFPTPPCRGPCTRCQLAIVNAVYDGS